MALRSPVLVLLTLSAFAPPARPGDQPDPAAVERGRKALQTRAFNTAPWTFQAYEEVWKLWDTDRKEKPADYPQAFMERYGLHPAPYDNGPYPMGLREGQGLFGKGLAAD